VPSSPTGPSGRGGLFSTTNASTRVPYDGETGLPPNIRYRRYRRYRRIVELIFRRWASASKSQEGHVQRLIFNTPWRIYNATRDSTISTGRWGSCGGSPLHEQPRDPPYDFFWIFTYRIFTYHIFKGWAWPNFTAHPLKQSSTTCGSALAQLEWGGKILIAKIFLFQYIL